MFPRTRKAWFFFAAIGLLVVQVLTLVLTWIHSQTQDPAWLSGFRGNVIGNLLGGLFFLALALYLSDEMEGFKRRRTQSRRRGPFASRSSSGSSSS